jgi:2-methylcitrate dehydratase PrpD
MLELGRDTSLDALGLVYSQLAGTMQAHVEGSVALPVQIAHAARAAVTAIDLARAGLDGPHDILDGPFGYFRLYERDGSLGGLLDSLGRPWRITELSHKPFPTGRAAHAMLHAMRSLQARHAFTLDDIDTVTVTVPPLVQRLVSRPARAGMSVNYARLCLEYLLARLLQAGDIDADAFQRDSLDDATLLAFGRRVDFTEDDSHGIDVLSPQSMQVVLKGGTTLRYDVSHTPGSPVNPLSRDERQQKFSRCITVAGIDPAPLALALYGLPATASARELLALASSASPRRR